MNVVLPSLRGLGGHNRSREQALAPSEGNQRAMERRLSDVAYIDWETWFPTGALGQKLNQDGSVLFQPLEDGIDLIGGSGRLEFRVQIPVTNAGVYDSLVIADSPNSLMVITANGVTFLDLSSLPHSLASSGASIERIGNHSSHAAAGTSLVNPQRQRYIFEQPTLRRRAKGARFSGH
jgi:hypothetical protein